MATHAADDLTWYLSINEEDADRLGPIRHWQNLRVGIESGTIWVRDLDAEQAGSTEVKCIPRKRLYFSKEGKLFPQGSLLPAGNVPHLLWTPIGRALPITLPAFNHNFFGIEDSVDMELVPATTEAEVVAMKTGMDVLGAYMETAPAVRVQSLKWVLTGDGEAMVFGHPLLSLPGQTYWRTGNFLLPAGYAFALPILSEVLEGKINPQRNAFVVFDAAANYFLVRKEMLQPLSISSFRASQKAVS